MALTAAINYASLGRWEEARSAIEMMETIKRMTPEALRLRLRCCSHLEDWGEGANIADLLANGDDLDREATGEFYHALAIHEARRGDMDFARDAIRKAVTAWPGAKEGLLNDLALAAVW